MSDSDHKEKQRKHLNMLLVNARETMNDTHEKVARLRGELATEEAVIWAVRKKIVAVLGRMTELGIAADE